jgi:hypothetical protein
MSATPTPRRPPPVDEEILAEFQRNSSVLKVCLSRYAGGSAISLSFVGWRDGCKHHRFVVVQPSEARAVARAIADACDQEGW